MDHRLSTGEKKKNDVNSGFSLEATDWRIWWAPINLFSSSVHTAPGATKGPPTDSCRPELTLSCGEPSRWVRVICRLRGVCRKWRFANESWRAISRHRKSIIRRLQLQLTLSRAAVDPPKSDRLDFFAYTTCFRLPVFSLSMAMNASENCWYVCCVIHYLAVGVSTVAETEMKKMICFLPCLPQCLSRSVVLP